MKENMLDVLLYLFEHYMNDEIEFSTDEESLREELLEAGFHQSEIVKAFGWLEGLAKMQNDPRLPLHLTSSSLRLYTGEECEKLDLECRGFILFLEQANVIDHHARELVIDRVMALDNDEIDIEQLKWVILMVLFNQPGQEAAYAWMEDLVFDEATGVLH